MSEDDRAAKAARAKAMLKKRQQKKAATVADNSGLASPTTGPSSRALSPALVEPPEESRDLGDIFTNDPSDTTWLNSLTKAPSPPPPPIPPTTPFNVNGSDGAEVSLPARHDALDLQVKRLESTVSQLQAREAELLAEVQRIPRLNEEVVNKEKLLQNEQQTVALLVSEKASLTAELDRLEQVQTKYDDAVRFLSQEQQKAGELEQKLQALHQEHTETTSTFRTLEADQKRLSDKSRDQERQLQLNGTTIAALRKDLSSEQRRVRELEEHIQSDDRAERLEQTLKHTQERADELEFQLSKAKQAHASVQSDYTSARTELHTLQVEFQNVSDGHSTLLGENAALKAQLESVDTDREKILRDRTSVEADLTSLRAQVDELTQRLQETASAMEISKSQLESAQLTTKEATKRAEDAEQSRRDLQAEGSTLMKSLEEMRPKIIELTGAKMELGEKAGALERALKSRDATIAQLEGSIDEVQDRLEQSEKDWLFKSTHSERALALAQQATIEAQHAHVKLQDELTSALASIRNLESERSTFHQDAARRMEDFERISAQSSTQEQELSALREEVEARTIDQEEEQSFLAQAQNEIEALRLDLANKDEELERLRAVIQTPTTDTPPRSLDDEVLSSLRQQHALEVSTLKSEIRSLQTSLYDADARNHTMQKQIRTLQDQVSSSQVRAFSPNGYPSRPSSRGAPSETHLHFKPPHKPSPLAPSRAIIEHNLSEETRHKRKVSLSMLKARIESEAAVSAPSRPHSRMSALEEDVPTATTQPHFHHRPSFLDEYHIFWCHSCRGDLVVL